MLIILEGRKLYNRNPISWIERFYNVSRLFMLDLSKPWILSSKSSLTTCQQLQRDKHISPHSGPRITFPLYLLTHFLKGKELCFLLHHPQIIFCNSTGKVRQKDLILWISSSKMRNKITWTKMEMGSIKTQSFLGLGHDGSFMDVWTMAQFGLGWRQLENLSLVPEPIWKV